jgi:molecular chaperone GrpE
MIFRLQEKEVRGTSAVDVVRALEREDKDYRDYGGPIRQYLSWSLNRLGGMARSNMESLEFAQDTTLSNNGFYEVSEGADMARLQEDLTTEREQRLRLLAEFDNYRRRTKEERALAEETGKREVLLALLDVKDDVDRALLHIRETSDAVADGLRLIQQRFNNLLEAHGVTAFESEGQAFDPEIHEAMTMIDGDGEQSGTVYSEHRRGYLMNGKLLRPARVAVLK